jgi:hypothetical protein
VEKIGRVQARDMYGPVRAAQGEGFAGVLAMTQLVWARSRLARALREHRRLVREAPGLRRAEANRRIQGSRDIARACIWHGLQGYATTRPDTHHHNLARNLMHTLQERVERAKRQRRNK